MSAPKYFQIEYEINPWMHVNNRVEPSKAKEEFENLIKIYKKIGLKVLTIDPKPKLYDMVFTANCGFVINNKFIKANFRYPQRREEARFAKQFFKNNGFKIYELPEGIFFEGQGDLLYRDGEFYCGYGKRTSKNAIEYLEKILASKINSFEVVNPYFYHFDTCFALLGNGRVIVNPDSFAKKDLQRMQEQFKKIIKVDGKKKEEAFLACNIVAYKNHLIMGKGAGYNIKKEIEGEGFEIIETPMHEYLKSGGSVKCVTLEFF